jgi:TetR/AcrR family transcriptional regulator
MARIRKDQSTEEKILQAARKVFIRDGMAGARMQDIADEAGMNKALLHYYFSNKEQLFQTIFKEVTLGFLPRMNAIFESDMPLFEKIHTFCREYIAQVSANPFIPQFLFSEMNRQPEKLLKKVWGDQRPQLQKLTSQVQQEIANGTIKPIHPLHLVMNMFAMCVFPFVAKPMLQFATTVTDTQFRELMEERKTIIPIFIIDAIRK